MRSEAQAQCYAIQSTERVALALGVSPADARLVSEAIALLEHRRPPGEYRSPECRPGGDYDLHPETPFWPSA